MDMLDAPQGSTEDIFGAPVQGSAPASDDIFGSPEAQQMNGSEDIFGTPQGSAQPSEDIFGAPTTSAPASGNPFGAPDANDDLYANGPTDIPQKESALVAWEAQRNQTIQEIDEKESSQDQELKKAATESLNAYHAKIEEAQQNRAKHNLEVDKETMESLETKTDNMWEGVVNYIDFNRNDLHEKDVSRMKSLLLQLKH